MDRDYIETSIKSYEARMADAKRRAIDALNDGSYWCALAAITEAAGYDACIKELEFQLEAMEVSHAL